MSFKLKHIEKNWQLLADGERQGLYECFDIFYDDLYRFGLSLYKNPELVKESINNLFIELWKIKDKLSSVKNIQQYVLTIFKRVLYKTYINSTCGMPFEGLEQEAIEAGLTEQSYETILIASQHDEHLKKRLQHALCKLSARQKELIQLRYFEQTSIEGIVEITGLTERTIYNTMYNAIKVLKEVFALLVIYNVHIK